MNYCICVLKSGRQIVVVKLPEPYVNVMHEWSPGDTWIPKSQAVGRKPGPFDWECNVLIEYVGFKRDLDAVKHLYDYYMQDPVVEVVE